jgi:hypothetical protein
MEDEVLRKLRSTLSEPLRTEKDVVYALVMVRKALQHKKPAKSYPMLDFFCSWALHVKLGEVPAERIVKIVDAELSKPITRMEDFDRDSKLGSLMNFHPFLAELDAFLQEHDLPRILTTDIYEQQIFLNLYVEIVGDCPLSSKKIEKPFKTVEAIKVKRNHEPNAVTEANPHMFHFVFDWTFTYKNGKSFTLPSVHSVGMKDVKGEQVPFEGYSAFR